jgi:hypothetical protein
MWDLLTGVQNQKPQNLCPCRRDSEFHLSDTVPAGIALGYQIIFRRAIWT